MRDTELYQNLLGIVAPWSVESVMMDVEKQRVDVTVSHPPNFLFACPECGTESPVFDHAEERVWRHLDSCQFFTYLHARVSRISCSTLASSRCRSLGRRHGVASPSFLNAWRLMF